ncbi:type III secretion system cytoplasmic ring protein SctQ [Hahella ganghwensis]|uniref:type III secretion system cytoplasmic ring protein SctQ n=1 Tax=Hahella ganghwensis TaxID=286420 RepID=UPI00037224E4|nr:type III secretion system cytoplasmic ring protein SctQ [Hahella ganghwensis]
MMDMPFILSPAIPQPLTLPEVSNTERQLQQWFPPDAELTLTLKAGAFLVRFLPEKTSRRLTYQLQISVNQCLLIVTIDQSLLELLLARITPDTALESLPFEQLPSQLQLALLQSALAPLIDQIATHSDLQIHVESMTCFHQNELPEARLICQCNDGNRTGRATLFFTEDTINTLSDQLSLLSLSAAKPPRLSQEAVEQLPLNISITLKGPSLSQAQINQLEPQDILLLKQTSATPRPEADQDISRQALYLPVEAKIQNRHLFYGVIHNTGIDITHINMDQPMEHSTEHHDNAELTQLNDLPLDVTFEIARQTTTLEHIKSLTAGQTFLLHKPLPSTVTLIVNGKAIAEAELVNVGEELGARISRLLIPATSSGGEKDDEPA